MYQLDPQPAKKKASCLGTALKVIGGIVVLFIGLIVVLALMSPAKPVKPTMALADIRAQAQTIPYKDLARDTEQYIGKPVKYDGKIVQVMEDSGSYVLRVNVTKEDGGFWDDTVLVTCDCTKRPLENDIVTLFGTIYGRTSYKTVLGATITLPQISAAAVDIK